MPPSRTTIASIVWMLGASQLIGYGTMYYAFAILAPHVAGDVGWPTVWVFGSLTLGLFGSGLISTYAGRLVDRHGAARVMAFGSVGAFLSLLGMALAPNGPAFAAAVVALGLVSPFVQYNAAFTHLAEIAGHDARRRIVHLTLIAGFASTLFWPLTTQLLHFLSWRGIYVLYAALNLLICLPLHLALRRSTRPHAEVIVEETALPETAVVVPAHSGDTPLPPHLRRRGLILVTFGFAVGGFMYSAVLAQMVPLLTAVGIGTTAVGIAALFGPAQVLVRVVNMLGGAHHHPIATTLAACALLVSAVLLLAAAAPATIGAIAFVVLFGFGSGLTSIVRGTLPLALFGRRNYGATLGRIASAQLIAASAAPFALSLLIDTGGTTLALLVLAATGLVGLAAFIAVTAMLRRERQDAGAVVYG